MKKVLAGLIFFWGITFFLNCNEDDFVSMIKFIRQDDYQNVFSLYANDVLIGSIPVTGILNWQQKSGAVTIRLQHENASLPIELEIKPKCLYEVFFKNESFTVRIYPIQTASTNQTKQVPFFLYLLPIPLILIFYILAKNGANKKSFKLGKSYFEKGKMTESISIFQKLVRSHSTRCEYWNYLEKAYLSNGEFDKAEICREQIKKLINRKKIKTTESELPTLKSITDELNRKGLQIIKLNMIKKIDQGKSAYGKYLVEVIIKETFITLFAVIKLPDKSTIYKQNDLLREAAGFQLLKKNWQNLLERHLPKESILVQLPENDVLFSYYAEESKTNQVQTLLSALESDFNKTLLILDKIRTMYLEKHKHLPVQNKHSKNIYLHIKETLSDKWTDLSEFEWQEFGLDRQKKYLNLKGNILPNAIYFLGNKKKWKDTNISLLYDVLHGDFNPGNCMITSTGNFVFIDFEKVGEKLFFYDLCFLSSWLLQKFALEANKDWENICQMQQAVYEIIQPFNRALSVSSQLVNMYSIYQAILPAKQELEENEQTAFDTALFSAFLLRSLYELRDSKSENKKLHQNNGLFFYAFACLILQKSDFLTTASAKVSTTFDFPPFS